MHSVPSSQRGHARTSKPNVRRIRSARELPAAFRRSNLGIPLRELAADTRVIVRPVHQSGAFRWFIARSAVWTA